MKENLNSHPEIEQIKIARKEIKSFVDGEIFNKAFEMIRKADPEVAGDIDRLNSAIEEDNVGELLYQPDSELPSLYDFFRGVTKIIPEDHPFAKAADRGLYKELQAKYYKTYHENESELITQKRELFEEGFLLMEGYITPFMFHESI